jgi:hypothetical protein
MNGIRSTIRSVVHIAPFTKDVALIVYDNSIGSQDPPIVLLHAK